MTIPIPTTDTERGIQPAPIGTRTLHGRPVSPGRYAGTVRVIHFESEFHRLLAGDVLVCSVILPVWTVLLLRVGALVTDSGGMLSNPAIVAREFGIPSVFATGLGTTLLRDGQLVIVDGTSGTVEVVR